MRNWFRKLRQICTASPRAPRSLSAARKETPLLEALEDRLTPSTLDLVGGVLSYTAVAGETNNVALVDVGSTTRLTDSGADITLGAGATAAGYTLTGTHTVQGPNATVTTINVQLGDLNDTMNVQAINHPTMVQTGDGNDTINVSSSSSLIGNLGGINANLGIDAGAGVNTLNVSDFTASSGNANVQISSNQITGMAGTSDGSTINYAATGGSFGQIRVLGTNSPSVAESFTVNNPNGALRLDANAGADTANIQNISAATSINMSAGNDIVNVSSDAPANLGTLDGIQGALTIDAGTGANTMHVSDFGQTVLPNDNIGVTPTKITGLAGASNASAINYRASGGTFSDLTVDGSNTLSDTFNVTGKTVASLKGNGADDTFNLAPGATAKQVDGGAGIDTLSYAAYTTPISVVLAGSDDTGFSGAGSTGLTTGFGGIDDLVSGSSLADSITGENVASTWDIGSTLTYSDGSHSLDVGGFEILNGGSDADTFNINQTTAGGVALTLNGNDGDDAFVAANWADVQGDITMDGGAGTNTLDVNDSANANPTAYVVQATDLQREGAGILSYANMSTVTLTAGNGAGNAIDIESTPAGSAVTVIGGTGGNDFQISQVANNLDSLQGDLTVVAGNAADTLTVNDQLNPNPTDYQLSDTTVTRSGAAAITMVNPLGQIAVLGGSDGNTFNVTPSTASTITVDGGTGGTSTLVYNANGSTTFTDDGSSITDPTAGVQPVFYTSFGVVSST